jgi:dTDP-4-dehydrorhamnose reductase
VTGIVLGGSGMLGQAVVATLVRAGANVLAPGHSELDVTNEIAVRKFITKNKPNYVVNCVAMTDVDGCEREPDKAKLINGQAVKYMASACKKVKAKFVHISTDYVFDGSSCTPYKEDDIPHPLQVYGESKLIGERHALDHGGSVFRVQWLFGHGKNNFIDWVCQSLLQSKQIPISDQQVGCPSSTMFVSNLIVLALMNCKSGIYHVAHDSASTRLEVAKYIAEYFRRDFRTCFLPVAGKFAQAERPDYTALSTDRLKQLLGVKTLGTWQSDVLAYISSKYTWNL